MNPRLLACVASLVPLLAPAADAPSKDRHAFSESLSQGGMHEECVHLRKDDSRHYEWSANAALDFNIHYHEGEEVFYPVKRDSLVKDKGTFRAKITQDYCWMWTAKAPAKLEGKIER